MRIRAFKSIVSLVLLWPLSFCTPSFRTEKADALFSRNQESSKQALTYCIQHRAQAEDYLIARYPSESPANRERILLALGFVGGEKSAVFICKLLLADPTMDPEDLNFRLNILGRCLSPRDAGYLYLHPEREMPDREVLVSGQNRKFITDTLATLEARIRHTRVTSGFSRSNLEVIPEIRREIE